MSIFRLPVFGGWFHRTLCRPRFLSSLLLAGLLVAAPQAVLAAHYYAVTSTADNTDSTIHGGSGTSASPYQMASLRGAVLAANNDAGSTITVPPGTFILSIAGHNDAGTAGNLAVLAAMTIQGAGSNNTIVQGGGSDKILTLNPLGNKAGFPVVLTGLRIQNGQNQQTDFSVGEYFGGAFDFDAGYGANFNGNGALTMTDVIVTQNKTMDGDGGGIAIFDGGTINITNCQFTYNTSNSQAGRGVGGGAIWFASNSTSSEGGAGKVTITNTTFDHNVVNGAGTSDPGGAIISNISSQTFTTSFVSITGCTFTYNTTTGVGGGVALLGPTTTTVQSSTFDHNTAGNNGGGICAGTATVTNSTITNNAANGTVNQQNNYGGGGVYCPGGTLTVSNCRIVGNTAALGGSAADQNSGQGTVSAANNWFGTNSPPASFFGTGVVSTPYLVMSIAASPTSVTLGQTSAVTASITKNSNAQTGFTVPNGTPVTYAATLGTINPPNSTLTSGTGTATFTAGSTPGNGSASATVDSQTLSATIAVIGQPTANAQSVNVSFNTAKAITLTGSDPNSPPRSLTYAIATNPSHGALSGFNASTGAVTYTPTSGYHGADSFMFTVNNGFSTSSATTVSLTVAAGTPTANPQSVSVPHNTVTGITLTGSDPDVPPLSLTFVIAASPSHGSLSNFNASTGSVTFTPTSGYHGTDGFTFTVSNGSSTSAAATVTLNVAIGVPTANAQNVNVAHNTATGITLTATDSETPAVALSYAIAANPSHGTLSGFNASTGAVTYAPTANYQGADSFAFTASNGTNTSAAATVSLTVAAGAPTANNQAVSLTANTSKGVTLTGTDPNTPPLTLTFSTTVTPAHGTLSGSSPNLTYTPANNYAGSDSFQFKANNGSLDSNIATVSITVNGIAPAITSANSTTFTVGTAGTFNVTATGAPSPTITLTGGTLPSGVNFGNGTLAGTLAAGTYGTYALTFTASNGIGTDATQSFSLVVNPSAQDVKSKVKISNNPGGGFRLDFLGNPGQQYTVQYSASLTSPNWQTLEVKVAQADGTFFSIDTPPAGTATRFYRAIVP